MAEKNSLWKNIRNKAKQNRRTGATPKKPTAEMLRQERKIKANQKADGGPVGDDDKLKPKYVAERSTTATKNTPEMSTKEWQEGPRSFGPTLNDLDVVTDVMQFGNFVPHPLAQAIGKVGNWGGAAIDSYQAAEAYDEGNYSDMATNIASAGLGAYLGAKGRGYTRDMYNTVPGSVADKIANLGSRSGSYRPLTAYPHLRNNPVIQRGLNYNRGILGGVGAETIYDNKADGGYLYAEGGDGGDGKNKRSNDVLTQQADRGIIKTGDYIDNVKSNIYDALNTSADYLFNDVSFSPLVKAETMNPKAKQYYFYNYSPVEYPSYVGAAKSIVKSIGNTILEGDPSLTINRKIGYDKQGDYDVAEEAWRKTLGLPIKHKYITKSKYKPSISSEDSEYYTLNPDIIDKQRIIDYVKSEDFNKESKPGKLPNTRVANVKGSSSFIKDDFMPLDEYEQIDPLQNFQIHKAWDPEKKQWYAAIYDNYDFSFKPAQEILEPFEIYDRAYYLSDEKPIEYNAPNYQSPKEVNRIKQAPRDATNTNSRIVQAPQTSTQVQPSLNQVIRSYGNPYMYYAGGPMQYEVGGKVWQSIGAGAYNLLSGALGTVSGGLTNPLMDMGEDALQKLANPNFDPNDPEDVKAMRQINTVGGAGKIGGSLLGLTINPANVGSAVAGTASGTNEIIKSSKASDSVKQWSQGLSGIAQFGNMMNPASAASSGNAVAGATQGANTSKFGNIMTNFSGSKFGKSAGKAMPFVNQAVGMLGDNKGSLLEQGVARQEYLNSPEYLAMKEQQNQAYVNQGLSFAANGGPVNNNLLTLQTDSMRENIKNHRKKYSKGGTFHKFGINKIPNSAGLHHENAYGGVPIGRDAMAEGGEFVIDGNYVISDEVDGMNTLTKDGKTMAEIFDKYLSPYKLRDLNSKNRDGLRRPNDSISLASIEQKKQQIIADHKESKAKEEVETQQKQMMVDGALQIAAAGGKLNKDLERILSDDIQSYVEADNYYAYGGYLPRDKGFNMPNSYAKGGSIHIKESKKGTFTAEAKKRGKSVQEFAKDVLRNKGNYSAAMVKKANFARNAAGWKHAVGGPLYGNTDSEYTYAHGGPVVSNINQGFGLYAQNRGGMMMAQGGMMQQQGGQDQMMQIVQQVGQMLVQGAQPEQVMQQLVESGIPEEQALQVVQIAMQDLQGQMQQQEQEQMMPQEMAHGGYIQYAKGGETGGIPIKLNPTQEHFANEMYNTYGKVILTDKGTNETIYGTKKQDGTWDLNKFEVLTGVNSSGHSVTGLDVDQINKLSKEESKRHKVTPLGVWGLQYKDDIYGMPGYELGNLLHAYHVTYKGKDDPNRSALYNNENIEDNYRSYGCINCEKPSMESLLNFAGKSGFSTIIDSRITPEENLKYMVKNTPKGASKYQKPKAKPAATTSAYDSRFSTVPSNLQPGAARPTPARPKTEQIKKQIAKQVPKQAPTKQVQQPTYMKPATPNQMPNVRQSVQQPVMQTPSSGYKGVSIVDYLNSVGMDSSKENRAKLAKQYGIENYNYSAQDNLALLDKLRGSNKTSSYAMGGNMYAVGGPPYDLPGMADMNPSEYNSINTYLNNLNTPNFVDDQGNTSSILSRMTNRQLSNNQPLNNQPSPDGPTRRMIGIDEYGEPIYQNVNTIPAQPMQPAQPAQPDVNYGDDYFLNRQSGVPMESYTPNNQVVNPTNTPQQQGQPTTNLFNVRNFTNLSDQGVDYVQNRPVQPMQSRNLQQLPTDNTKPGLVNDVERYGFEGVDASGNPVSVNPNMADEYMGGWRPEGTTMPENPNMFNNVLNKVGKFATRDNLTALAQMAAPFHQFFQKKPEAFNYNTASAKTVDPTEAIAIADAKLRQSENVADYNTRQNAPSSGSYLANTRANALTFGNKRAITGAGIKQQYDLNNANILNEFEQYNTGIKNANIDARQKDLANWQEQRTNALYNAGANLAGINKDANYREMYKNYIAPNIGTGNYEYVQDPDGRYRLVPRQGSNSTFQVTKPETGTPTTNPAAPATPITLKEDVTAPQKYTQSLAPGTFNQNDPEQVKGFQDWMDTYHPNWAQGKNLNKKGKGYGRFGSSTKSAYDNYMYEYYGLNPNINQFPI